MKIDYSLLQTAQSQAEAALNERRAAAKAECKRRITAVLSESAQLNLAADAATGRLTAPEIESYTAWCDWVVAMRGSWSKIADAAVPLSSDQHWPTLPQLVADFVRKS